MDICMPPKAKEYDELIARPLKGTKRRIEAVLGDFETVANFLRVAIENEIKRREDDKKKGNT